MSLTYFLFCAKYCDTQDAVDILDTLLDPRNDMSFENISTQVHMVKYILVRLDYVLKVLVLTLSLIASSD